MTLFGSSGIRGIVNRRITPEFAVRIGSAIGTLHEKTIIGYDTRTSNIMMSSAIISGILSAGADVYNAGILTTPALAYATRRFDCGIMVTASHNPPQYNGIKLWNPTGMAFTRNQEEQIETMLEKGNVRKAEWDEIGGLFPYENANGEHMEFIKKRVGRLSLKVVVDCGSGPASFSTPYLFREMGCRVYTINSHPDGHFPGRDPEPVEENLGALKSAVLHHEADLGIAHDGDADRMVAVDDMGNYVGGDALLLLFTKYVAKKRIVVPVDSSMALEEYGKEVIRTRIGDAFISQEMHRQNADFGGEPSGTWIFSDGTLCPDGPYAAAILAKMIEKKGSLSQMIGGLKRYPIIRGKIDYDPCKRDAIQNRIWKTLESEKGADVSKIDGIRLDYGDSWAVVRFSGTEPKIRITVEAKNRRTLAALYKKMQKIVLLCTHSR